MNSIVYFEIQSSCLEREANFYRNVFGWNITKDEAVSIPYYRIETDGIRGALMERPAAVVPMSGTNAFTCSIEVAHFDETAGIILANGGKIALPKFAIPGKCWEGYFLDPDQNVFGIFEVITCCSPAPEKQK
ncbi:MAG: VOC family protein [Treponema sp.]|jgi:predicted enzyme related to lactoylglutathione lyase|nr:VOC family protein [Treponema sp.]